MKHIRHSLIALLLFSAVIPLQANVLSYTQDSDGITCKLDKGLMKLKLCFDNMVEVKYTTLPLFIEKPSLVITNPFKLVPTFKVTDNANDIVITTPKLKITVDKTSNAIAYADLSGNIILAEDKAQTRP